MCHTENSENEAVTGAQRELGAEQTSHKNKMAEYQYHYHLCLLNACMFNARDREGVNLQR